MTKDTAYFKKLAIEAARAADDKKASDILLFDLQGRSPLADFVLLVSADSLPQIEAVDENIGKRLKEYESYMWHHEVTSIIAHEYFYPLRGKCIDTLILGCTHYPVIKHIIQHAIGYDVRMQDPQ